MQPVSETLVEEMVVEFEFKGIHCGALHYRRWELIPLLNDVIGKEELSAVKLYSSIS